MTQKMKDIGFMDARERAVSPRIIVSISGLEKQGKTHFALSAPGPTAMFSTDIGEEGVINKFWNDKQIQIMDVGARETDRAEEEFDRFKLAYNTVLEEPEIQTIVLDTASEVWELLRLARFGRLTQVMPLQYGPVNNEYRQLIRTAYNYDKNLILLHKMKAQYVNDKWNGEYIPAAFNGTGFLVQVNARIHRYSPTDGGEFALKVGDCRQNPDLAGEELVGPMCSFPMLAGMVLPNGTG